MQRLRNLRFPGGAPGFFKAVAGVAGLGAVGYGGYESLYTVEGGHRAVLYSRLTGVGDQVYSEGMHFKVPWLQRPIIFDVRTRPTTINSLTGTKDLQMVNISLRVLTKPNISSLEIGRAHV